jgi:hypothetical protein
LVLALVPFVLSCGLSFLPDLRRSVFR